MTPIKTDERLSLAMQFVREGSVVADIGTDHGYIPVALLTGGVCPFAYASDVNAMPLDKARANAEKYGVSDRVSLHLSDGLRFIDEDKTLPEHPVDDIVICGMGGELIARIIDDSAYAKRDGVRLILQPMTMADKLREYLAENGFSTVDERLCSAAGKTYTVICAEHDGVIREITPVNALLGEKNIARGGVLFEKYARSKKAKLETKIRGLTSGGYDCAAETALLGEVNRIIEETRTEQ